MEKLIELAPNWAGIFALPISLFAVYLHWRTYRRDKGKVTITDIEFRHPGPGGTQFIVSFVNSGRRPICLELARLRMRSKPYWIDERFSKPRWLSEGEKGEKQFFVHTPQMVRSETSGRPGLAYRFDEAINPIEVVAAEVVDTTGKRYKRKLTRRQRKEIARRWRDEKG